MLSWNTLTPHYEEDVIYALNSVSVAKHFGMDAVAARVGGGGGGGCCWCWWRVCRCVWLVCVCVGGRWGWIRLLRVAEDAGAEVGRQ